MKRTSLLFAVILFCTCILLTGCGKEESQSTAEDENGYYPSSISVSSFTAVAGEKIDETKTAENGTTYIYEIKDPQIGAAAYDLYKDYLNQNFTYSMIDSSVTNKGYSSVYTDTQSGKQIIYTEAIDKDNIYTITVTVPD